MKKISLLTIIALIVMSVVFLASCDNPAGAAATDPLADATKALEAINTAVKADSAAKPAVEDLETATVTLTGLVPATGVQATDKADVTTAVGAFDKRVAGLEKLAATAVEATAKIVKDEKTYDKAKATALDTVVAALETIILGGKGEKAEGDKGIVKATESLRKDSLDVTAAADAKAINDALVALAKRLGTKGDDAAIVKLAEKAVAAAKALKK